MWLKIKVWTKIILASALGLYLILFVYNNSGDKVQFWWWFGHSQQESAFILVTAAFMAGIVCTLFIGMLSKTAGQLRELKNRNRSQKIQRDLADMKVKAEMLQQRAAPIAPDNTVPDELPIPLSPPAESE